MKNLIMIVQILVSGALITAILLQSKGTGLGSAFGGASEQYRSKRGVEKLLYRGTISLIALFLITSVLNLLLH